MIEFPTNIKTVAFMGDLHCDYRYTPKALKYAKKYGAQAIVQLGDFGYHFPDTFLDMINDWCAENDVFFLFVDGNHEDFDVLYSYPVSEDGVRRLRSRLWHLPRGFRWNWSGVNFLALGGAHSVDRAVRTPGASWWPQETITYKDLYTVLEGNDGKAVDVMVTHDAPDNVYLPIGNGSWIPEADLRAANFHREMVGSVVDAVYPLWLFHGHYRVYHEGTRPYSTDPDVDTKTTVIGLNCNGNPFDQVVKIVDVETLK